MKNSVFAVLLSATVLAGCATDQAGTKQNIGTVLGAVGGALLGSSLGKGDGRFVGVAAGALAGAWIGNQIGKSLDETDRRAVSKKTNQALSQARNGQSVSWANPDAGASAIITPRTSTVESRNVAMLRANNIQSPGTLDLIGSTYIASKSVNLRSGPSSQTQVVGNLKTGERFQAVGQVVGTDWILVGQNSRSVGYVYGPLVEEAPAVQVAAVSKAKTPESQVPVTDRQQSIRPPIDLDALENDEAIDLDAEGLVAENVAVTSACRTGDVVISKGGSTERSNIKACKGIDGAWEIL